MRGGRSERENRNPRDKDSSTCDDASAFYSQDKAHTTYRANGDGGGKESERLEPSFALCLRIAASDQCRFVRREKQTNWKSLKAVKVLC